MSSLLHAPMYVSLTTMDFTNLALNTIDVVTDYTPLYRLDSSAVERPTKKGKVSGSIANPVILVYRHSIPA
jgi:hypothetical protein